MKQLVFSFPDSKIPVINLVYGDFTNDGFKPETDLEVLRAVYKDLFGERRFGIHFDKYFNNLPFINVEDFNVFFSTLIPSVKEYIYYTNFLVCTLKSDDYGTKEEKPSPQRQSDC